MVETPTRIAGTSEPGGDAVELDGSVFTTKPGEPRPAIVLSHGFNGSKADSAEAARRLAGDGYTVITFTARGFGDSGGLIHLDHPDFEIADLTKIIDFAATLPDVLKNGADPVVGLAGVSYGGAATLFGGADPRVDAIAPAFTWNSLPQALFPQYATGGSQESPGEVDPIDAAGVFKARWAALFFLDTKNPESPDQQPDQALCGRFALDLCRAYLETAKTGRPNPTLVDLLDRSSPEHVLSRISAPTMIIAGENDSLFPLDHADANFRGLPASTPSRMAWVTGGHDGDIALDPLIGELESWFGKYLRGEDVDPGPAFRVAIGENRPSADGEQRPTDQLTSATYPGRNAPAMQRGSLALDGDRQRMIAPPGGVPAALTNLPGLGRQIAALTGTEAYRIGVLPGQSVSFTSEPVAEPLTLVGSPRARVRLTSSTDSATLFAALWDLGPDTAGGSAPTSAVLPGLAVAPIRVEGLEPGKAKDVAINLAPIAHRFGPGHRVQLVISSTDQAYALPDQAAAYQLELVDESLDLPSLAPVESAPVNRFSISVGLPIAVGLLILGAIGAIAIGRRRAAALAGATEDRPDLRDTPLAVDGLTKSYRERFAARVRAVDQVSFRAEPGQVVGLLGPNGAGKTTTIRMLMGLIKPDAGTAYVLGQTIRPGAPVLRSVGALVEGPGFLPHLSGLDNLRAYWAATGRPIEEAQLDEALRIADLGTAAKRRVRGYSQGMRQRLGIAQAMLGLPQLLILDEPVNGLDPPQIRAMRAMLSEYAASGRTVLLSSHLLAEVELTCSHVVMMHQGRVLTTGSVEELTERHGRRLEDVFMDQIEGTASARPTP